MIDKSFIEKIEQLSKTEIISVDGLDYSSKTLYPVDSPKRAALDVHTLTGIVDYVQENKIEESSFIHVYDPKKVILDEKEYTKFNKLQNLMVAEAFQNKFNFGNWYDLETFIISIQACFVQDETTAAILKVIGNIKDERIMQFGDDGISQSVTAKAGIALIEEMKIPNPVTLRPYRTFLEIEQPSSTFVFRMKSGGGVIHCSLHEADGGLWQNQAIISIKHWLREKLPTISIIA